jgi:primosomal protein N' (replication factor Y) (superfamily II helicase)
MNQPESCRVTEVPSADILYAAVHILECPLGIDRPYHYYIPRPLADAVRPGAFVTVPFGKGNRKKLALAVGICDRAGLSVLPDGVDPDRLKPVSGVCRERLFLTEGQLAICGFLTEQTLCTVGDAVRALVPAQALATLAEFYRPVPGAALPAERLPSAGDLLIYEYIRARGSVSAQALRSRFGARAATALDMLTDRGLVERELDVREPDERQENFYVLARPTEEIRAALAQEKGAGRILSAAQRTVLYVLLEAAEPISGTDLRQHSGVTASVLRALTQKGLVRGEARRVLTERPAESSLGDAGLRTPFSLSSEQADAVRVLSGLADSGEARAALLFGVTGSGKTCVILSMIDRMLDAGRGCIMMLPEIALTPQMLSIFRARYGYRVAVIHSGLSGGERLDAYRRIRTGEAPVVVGTRSAVFAPVPNLGMIVIDEEQEHTYKSDQNPKYHARDVARFRCVQEKALLLLSSATPSLESFRKAEEGKYTLIPLRRRFGKAQLPEVRIADMRREAQRGQTAPLGQELVSELKRVRAEGNQSVLFLNRRGYSTQLVCRSCGLAVTCPACSVAMNYHTLSGGYDRGEMVCHWCGSRRPVPETCPSCGSPHLVRMGFGTQRIQQELERELPGVRVMRMDADTTGTKSAYHDMLSSFRGHGADILLGTQMVTKGHDFPDVTLVGVLLADMSLYVDDYRAAERTFSLLTQVIGRAGRADKPGLAIIQTMNPDSDVLKLACAQDYETFYAREVRLRRNLAFPPFCDIAMLTLTSPDEKELQKSCLRLTEEIRRLTAGGYSDVPIQMFGPFEAPVYRVDNVYRMRAVIKCRLTRRTRAMFSELLQTFSALRQRPVLSVDFNPSSI